MKYHHSTGFYSGYRVGPFSEWLAKLTASGYAVRRAYRPDLAAESKSSFWVYDERGRESGLLIRCDAGQHSRWACNVW